MAANRSTKERKLISLMVNDLEAAELSESQMTTLTSEVESLSEDELDRILTSRLGLPHDTDEESLEDALNRVAEPELISGSGPQDFTRAPDMSHEPRPEERES